MRGRERGGEITQLVVMRNANKNNISINCLALILWRQIVCSELFNCYFFLQSMTEMNWPVIHTSDSISYAQTMAVAEMQPDKKQKKEGLNDHFSLH